MQQPTFSSLAAILSKTHSHNVYCNRDIGSVLLQLETVEGQVWVQNCSVCYWKQPVSQLYGKLSIHLYVTALVVVVHVVLGLSAEGRERE